MTRFMSNQRKYTLDNVLSKLSCPLLLLWGDLDPWVGPAKAKRIEEFYPNTSLVNLQAGHCPHDEVPELVNKALLDWLSNLTSQPFETAWTDFDSTYDCSFLLLNTQFSWFVSFECVSLSHLISLSWKYQRDRWSNHTNWQDSIGGTVTLFRFHLVTAKSWDSRARISSDMEIGEIAWQINNTNNNIIIIISFP